jgi:hypothetical protein
VAKGAAARCSFGSAQEAGKKRLSTTTHIHTHTHTPPTHSRTLSSYTGTLLLRPALLAVGSLELLPRRLPKKEALALAFILSGCFFGFRVQIRARARRPRSLPPSHTLVDVVEFLHTSFKILKKYQAPDQGRALHSQWDVGREGWHVRAASGAHEKVCGRTMEGPRVDVGCGGGSWANGGSLRSRQSAPHRGDVCALSICETRKRYILRSECFPLWAIMSLHKTGC